MRKTSPKSRPPFAFLLATLLLAAAPAGAAVEGVPVGVKFTYEAPGAGSVYLAGTFNGWDAQRNALVDEGDGVWSIVMALKPGKYEYKFVVDGAWFADPENPDTAPDSYGGTNSVVTIGDDGKLVPPSARPATGGPNTTFNPKVTLDGRYLGRYMAWKNHDGDPRYRLERPEQNVDLNFHTKVSELVDAYTRLRLDNTTNIVLNNIHAQMDEGSLDVHPQPFHVLGYWNMETLELGDPLSSGGDVDLAGTIMDDHLKSGKGTAGVLINGSPLGVDYQGFFADVHDANYYNDIRYFDNTGRDIFGSRLSHEVGGVTVGVPYYMQRDLIWTELSGLLGGDSTGIPALDTFLARTGDSSDWFELDRLDQRIGLDLTIPLSGDRGRFQCEWLYVTHDQRFVTGNHSGYNQSNGPVDVPLSTRAFRIFHASMDQRFGPGARVNVEHTSMFGSGAQPDETQTGFTYGFADTANGRIYVTYGPGLPSYDTEYTEMTWTFDHGDRTNVFWVQRFQRRADYAAAGLLSPEGQPTDLAVIWTLSTRNALGTPESRFGRWELLGALTLYDDHQPGLPFLWNQSRDLSRDAVRPQGRDGHTMEWILRGDRKISRRMHALADVRTISYAMDVTPSGGDPLHWGSTYVTPWVGLQYLPHPRLDVTFFFGVDPLNYGIDYDGRQIGRWLYRERYLAEHAGSTLADAERSLAEARVFGIRANLRF